MLVAPQQTRIALKFNPPEIFALTLIGLTCISPVSRGLPIKGLIAGSFGLLVVFIILAWSPLKFVVKVKKEEAPVS